MPAVVTNWNISNMTQSGSNYIDVIRQVSVITNYTPGTLIVFAFVFILFISLKMKGVPTNSAFTATAFAHFIFCLILFPLGVIAGLHMIIALIMLPIAALTLYMNG